MAKMLREAKYGQRSIGEEMEEYIYDLEQGPILREDAKSDEEEGRLDECLKKWMESAKLEHREMKEKETKESHDFETKCLCVNADYMGQEDE